MRNIENDLKSLRRKSVRRFKKTREGPLTKRYRVILTFFIIGCLTAFLFSGVRDGYGADISIPVRINYGSVPVGGTSVQSFAITNTGKSSFTILEVPKWAPPDHHWWTVVSDNCTGVTLSTKQSCTLTYTFSPPAINSYDYTLNIPYTYDQKTVNNANTHFYGTGIKGTPTITWNNPADIAYGTALSSTQLNASASVPGTFVYTPALGVVLNASNSQPLSVTFTPTDTVNYNTATKTVWINVSKATAAITLTNLTQPYTGSALTPTASTTPSGLAIVWTGAPQTNAGTYPVMATVNDPNYQGSASGTFTINKATVTTITLSDLTTQTYTGSPLTPTVTTVPTGLAITWTGAPQTNAGTYPVTAAVNDPNYTGSASGTFVIQKATPGITWSSPADITYGTPLSSTQLNATASVDGTFAYTPAAGTPPNVGTQTLHVEFTPTDITNYSTASADVTIIVLQATPTIAWNNPADITHPTPLTTIQLNATASVEGTFTYSPPLCTVLNEGNGQTLRVTFTSSDPNYGTTEATATINVLAPYVTKDQIFDSWVCTERDRVSGLPIAMYLCTGSDGSALDCSTCISGGDRCGELSLAEVHFTMGALQWAGPGSSKNVDFITSTVLYRCIERLDLCFGCGLPWTSTCNGSTPSSLDLPTVTTTTLEKIGNVWVCSGTVDQSGCAMDIYSCPDQPGRGPCDCDPPVVWNPLTPSQVSFAAGELEWAGTGSGNANFQIVYFVTKKIVNNESCIYKCISCTAEETEICYSNCP